MPSDTHMIQHADLKVLMPLIKQAAGGKDSSISLTMVGPVYIGGKPENGQEQPEKIEAAEPQPVIEYREVSTDDLFCKEVTLDDFRHEAEGKYFRLIASKYNFNRERIMSALDISERRVYQLAKQYGVVFSTKARKGQLTVKE